MTARRRLTGLAFIAPSLVVAAVFFVLPLGLTIWMSLHDWPLFGGQSFTGLENYRELAQDETFWDGLWFTTRYTVLVTIVIFAVAFGLALLVRRNVRGIGFFRTVYFLPVVIGLAASSLLWGWLYNPEVGGLPALLQVLGITEEPVQWLAESDTALLAVIVSVVWKTVGLTMLLLLIGIQSIPSELTDAAATDGAGRWASMRHITLPLLRRTLALALVLSVTGSYLAFDQFYILTRGGPDNSTITAVFTVYRSAFVEFELGYAAAAAVVLLVGLGLLNALQIRLLRPQDR